MIKSNELMIGNLLTDLSGNQREVCQINKRSCLVFSKFDLSPIHWNYRALEPIPIEEEFLINKFGFSKAFKKMRIRNSNFYIAISLINKVIAIIGLSNDSVVRIPLPAYVHQLQNLIYSVTGEELKIISDEEE